MKLPPAQRRLLVFFAVAFVVNITGALALDALGLTESLLSGSVVRTPVAIVLGLLFFIARLAVYFVAPGLVLASLALYAVEYVRSRDRH